MTLEKAKEIIQLNLKEADKKMPPDVRDALKLLTEAGTRIQVGRNNPGTYWTDLLPGETPE